MVSASVGVGCSCFELGTGELSLLVMMFFSYICATHADTALCSGFSLEIDHGEAEGRGSTLRTTNNWPRAKLGWFYGD